MTMLHNPKIREILRSLLDKAAAGRVTYRDGKPWLSDGMPWIDGHPGNLLQVIAVSIMQEEEWLIWWPEAEDSAYPRTYCCCLTEAGERQLRQWDTELYGPAEPFQRSRRPLLDPVCLEDMWSPDDDRQLRDLLDRAEGE